MTLSLCVQSAKNVIYENHDNIYGIFHVTFFNLKHMDSFGLHLDLELKFLKQCTSIECNIQNKVTNI